MALSIVIILFFLGALFLLEWPLLKRSWEIGQLLSSCRRLKAEDKRELQLGMNSIMDGMAWLREPMSRFEKTWRGAFSDELGHAIGECEFADFIGSKDLFPKGLFQLAQNRQLARSIPGILVAAGILGTFLGLVQSLPSLAKIEGQESLKGIISPVVEGLGLAFYTSLAGIFCSILFLLIDRIAVQILEQRVTELSYFVGTAYPTISPAEARTFLLDQVQDGVETLRTMGADLASELAKELKPALSEAMAEQLTPVMERMQDTVEELAARTTERQVEGIQQLVDGFMDSMNSSMGHQFQTLTEVLDSTVEFQVKIRDGLINFSEKLESAGTVQMELLGETRRAAEVLSGSLDRLEQISSMLSDAAQRVLEAAGQLQNVVEGTEELQRRSHEQAEAVAASTKAQVEALAQGRAQLFASWQLAVDQAQTTVRQLQNSQEQIEASLVKALTRFDGTLAEVLDHFSGTLNQVDGSVAELPPAAQEIRDSSTAMAKSGEELRKAVTDMKAMVTGMVSKNTERAVQAASQLQNAVSVAENSANDNRKTMQQLQRSLDHLREALEDRSSQGKGKRGRSLLDIFGRRG